MTPREDIVYSCKMHREKKKKRKTYQAKTNSRAPPSLELLLVRVLEGQGGKRLDAWKARGLSFSSTPHTAPHSSLHVCWKANAVRNEQHNRALCWSAAKNIQLVKKKKGRGVWGTWPIAFTPWRGKKTNPMGKNIQLLPLFPHQQVSTAVPDTIMISDFIGARPTKGNERKKKLFNSGVER